MKVQLNFKVKLECVKKVRICYECEDYRWRRVEEDGLHSNTLRQKLTWEGGRRCVGGYIVEFRRMWSTVRGHKHKLQNSLRWHVTSLIIKLIITKSISIPHACHAIYHTKFIDH